MLDNDITEPSYSELSYRCIIVTNIVVDFRNVNIMSTLHYSLTIVLLRFGIKIYGSKFD